MVDKCTLGYSLDEWMELATEFQQSNLMNAAWYNEHGISPSCFYNAATCLCKKACPIPDQLENPALLTLHLISRM